MPQRRGVPVAPGSCEPPAPALSSHQGAASWRSCSLPCFSNPSKMLSRKVKERSYLFGPPCCPPSGFFETSACASWGCCPCTADSSKPSSRATTPGYERTARDAHPNTRASRGPCPGAGWGAQLLGLESGAFASGAQRPGHCPRPPGARPHLQGPALTGEVSSGKGRKLSGSHPL